MGPAFFAFAQLSALDALDAWEARLREAERFAVTVAWEGVEGPQRAEILYEASGRFRFAWELPGERRWIAVSDGVRIAYAPMEVDFLPAEEAGPGFFPALLLGGVRLWLTGGFTGARVLSRPNGEYAVEIWDDVFEVGCDVGELGELRERRVAPVGGDAWVERYSWDLEPELPPGALEVPWDFGLPPCIESHPWVAAPGAVSLDLRDATLLRAAGELIALCDVPVEADPRIADRRGTVTVRQRTPLEAAREIAAAWAVALEPSAQRSPQVEGGAAIRFRRGAPPTDLARTGAGPFEIVVEKIDEERRLPGPSSLLHLSLAVEAAGARWLDWIVNLREAVDDHGSVVRILQPEAHALHELEYWRFHRQPVLQSPQAGARSVAVRGVLVVLLPEEDRLVTIEPPYDVGEIVAGEVRLRPRVLPGEGAVRIDIRANAQTWPWPLPAAGLVPVNGYLPQSFSFGLGRQGPRGQITVWASGEPLRVRVFERLRRVDFPFEIRDIPLP